MIPTNLSETPAAVSLKTVIRRMRNLLSILVLAPMLTLDPTQLLSRHKRIF